MKVKNAKGAPNKVTFKTSDQSGSMVLAKWWEAKGDVAAKQLLTSAAYLKETQAYRYRQAATYARLYGNQSLFSFAGTNMSKMDQTYGLPQERPTFNLVQSCVDTLVSRITQNRPSPRFLTDGANYKQRTMGKKLNNFVGGEFYHTKAYEKGGTIFRDALVEGTGVAHVYEDENNRVAMERVLLTELLVDPNEAMYGEPRRLYRLKLVDREVLLASFPKFEAKIEAATKATPDNGPDASKTVADLVMVVESWSLPSGKDTNDGRHMIVCSEGALVDEAYEKERFPFSFMHYSPRLLGFWAQGLAEQLMGTQMELNSILYTISRSIKLMGVPRVLIEDGSKVVSAHINNEIGSVIKYRGTKPEFAVNQSNANDLYAERDKLISYGYQQTGVSAMQAQAAKPAGLDSGEAIRSYDDISTDRFAALARRYDNFYVDLAYLMIDLAKDIAKRDSKYSTIYPGKDGTSRIDLPKAALIDDAFVIQCFTQSSLPKDPAGRLQKVTEMIQSGMISIQEGRRLLDYPDLEQEERLANAGQERIYKYLDDIIESNSYTPPDTFIDLDLAQKITTQYINLYLACGLEEDKADSLRSFFSQCQTIKMAAQTPPMPQPGANPPQAVPEALPTSPLLPNAGVAAAQPA